MHGVNVRVCIDTTRSWRIAWIEGASRHPLLLLFWHATPSPPMHLSPGNGLSQATGTLSTRSTRKSTLCCELQSGPGLKEVREIPSRVFLSQVFVAGSALQSKSAVDVESS